MPPRNQMPTAEQKAKQKEASKRQLSICICRQWALGTIGLLRSLSSLSIKGARLPLTSGFGNGQIHTTRNPYSRCFSLHMFLQLITFANLRFSHPPACQAVPYLRISTCFSLQN